MRHALFSVVSVSLLLWMPEARVTANQPSTGAMNPGPRSAHALVYARSLQRVILLDGYVSGMPAMTELWSWDGRGWSIIDGAGPPARMRGAAVYDNKRNRLVVFGGRVGADAFTRGDTWLWAGNTSRELADLSVGIRDHHAMAYDERRGVVVLFGGTVPPPNTPPRQQTEWTYPTATWELNGDRWTNVTDVGPGERNIPAMTYDASRRVVVLFGGAGQDRVNRGDTWTWDGNTWQQVATTGPRPRGDGRMAYDHITGDVILYGGSAGGRQQLQDMWRWDGRRWAEIPLSEPNPGPRVGHAMVFDPSRGKRLVLYGGYSGDTALADTWEWDGRRWVKAQ